MYADEQSYEEMISALREFVSKVEEECMVMEQAGKDCVDNTDGDPAAVTSNEKLCNSIKIIQDSIAVVEKIIRDLEEELNDIKTAAKIAEE